MQVIAYMRHLEYMPANVNSMLVSLNNAVTFKPVYEWIAHSTLGKQTNASDNSIELGSERWGVENKSLFWSFGIFAVVFIILCLLFVFYYIIHHLQKKYHALKHVEMFMLRKLFFGSPIRLLFVAYLKVTHNSIFFLYLQENVETGYEKL